MRSAFDRQVRVGYSPAFVRRARGVVAVALLIAAPLAARGDDYQLEVVKEPAPKGALSADIAAQLAPEGLRVVSISAWCARFGRPRRGP